MLLYIAGVTNNDGEHMQIPQEIRDAIDEARRLAPTMRGYTVRTESPMVGISNNGAVVITLPSADPDVMDAWVSACRTLTGGTVSTNTQRKIIFFRP